VTAPSAMPATNSAGESGAISKSAMLPCTLATRSEEDELVKAFCAIAITMRPGARKAR
jgi:hypothetical protein